MATQSATNAKKVLITGGTGSVGKSLIETFSKAGHNVAFQYRSDENIAKKLEQNFNANPIKLDFTNSCDLPEVEFDIVINNAGINISDAQTHEVSIEDWELTLQINLTTPFKITKQCLPWMLKQGWGRIINISSIYGLRVSEDNFPYTVSKHGLSGLTKTIAREYAKLGITCNEICPGPIDSEMMNRIAAKSAAEEGISTDEYFEGLRQEIPANRMAKPKEIAALALFLTSNDADYINGVSIPVDGAMIT